MEDRNPYAAPKAPVVSADEPTRVPGDPEEFEYGGFWPRVGAAILDNLIQLPVGLLLFLLIYLTPRAYLYYALPGIAFSLFYYVYLVQRFGGTPGKRIVGMRITMTDGSPVTTRAALLRYSPYLVMQAFSMLSMIQATSAPIDGFDSMGFLGKMQAMQVGVPYWGQLVTYFIYLWWVVAAIVLVANRRKRATHDFIADTVVLRTG